MIGLDITVKNKYGSYLETIFYGLNYSDYIWNIIADQIFYKEDGHLKQGIFNRDVLSGVEFEECLSRKNYYLVFADIKAYLKGSRCSIIETLDDFLESECEFILLCVDTSFIEFYCKDRILLDKVYSNCIGDDIEDVKYTSIEDVKERSLVAF